MGREATGPGAVPGAGPGGGTPARTKRAKGVALHMQAKPGPRHSVAVLRSTKISGSRLAGQFGRFGYLLMQNKRTKLNLPILPFPIPPRPSPFRVHGRELARITQTSRSA